MEAYGLILLLAVAIAVWVAKRVRQVAAQQAAMVAVRADGWAMRQRSFARYSAEEERVPMDVFPAYCAWHAPPPYRPSERRPRPDLPAGDRA